MTALLKCFAEQKLQNTLDMNKGQVHFCISILVQVCRLPHRAFYSLVENSAFFFKMYIFEKAKGPSLLQTFTFAL